MNEKDFNLWRTFERRWLNRRDLVRQAAGMVLGVGLFRPRLAYSNNEENSEYLGCVGPNPIPEGVTPLKPFGIFVHHNGLDPAKPLADLNDQSHITDFDGFVGRTHIRSGGTGTDTTTGVSTPLAFQANMGFNQGKFIATDGRQHEGTFVHV